MNLEEEARLMLFELKSGLYERRDDDAMLDCIEEYLQALRRSERNRAVGFCQEEMKKYLDARLATFDFGEKHIWAAGESTAEYIAKRIQEDDY